MDSNDGRRYDALLKIQTEFPMLTYSYKGYGGIKNLFKAVENLAYYTKEQLLEENQAEIEHCFAVVREILDRGGNIARLAIENVFIYNISHLLEVSLLVSPGSRTKFLKVFRTEYANLVCSTLP